jgi:hypothetical protein
MQKYFLHIDHNVKCFAFARFDRILIILYLAVRNHAMSITCRRDGTRHVCRICSEKYLIFEQEVTVLQHLHNWGSFRLPGRKRLHNFALPNSMLTRWLVCYAVNLR